MDNNALMLLGMVKMQHPVTKQVQVIEARGFDILGLFFPFLRYLIAGQIKNFFVAALICCTIIGYPIVAWYTAFNFRKMTFEHMLKEGWQVVTEETPAKSQAAA